MHVFVWLTKAADFLSTSEHLQALQDDFPKVGNKKLLMILSQKSYDRHSAGNVMFRGNRNNKVWII